jgi:hypothetical protein
MLNLVGAGRIDRDGPRARIVAHFSLSALVERTERELATLLAAGAPSGTPLREAEA